MVKQLFIYDLPTEIMERKSFSYHTTLVNAIDNYYAKTKIPRIVYLKAAHMTFRKTLKENKKRN